MESEAARHLVDCTVPAAEPGRSAPSNRGMAELEDAMGALSAQAPIAVVHGVGQRGEVRQATLSEAVAHTGSAFASGTPVEGDPFVWWPTEGQKHFPYLYHGACSLLSHRSGNGFEERVFSKSGRILADKRVRHIDVRKGVLQCKPRHAECLGRRGRGF